MTFVKVNTPLRNLLIRIFGEDNKDYVFLSMNWRKMVGEYLADNSYVYRIEKDVLFVGVANGVVMQELSLLRDSLQKKITKQLKIKLREIIFFVKDDAVKN